jgi:flagellar biosynthesis/type III secretory pathway protein FliH
LRLISKIILKLLKQGKKTQVDFKPRSMLSKKGREGRKEGRKEGSREGRREGKKDRRKSPRYKSCISSWL